MPHKSSYSSVSRAAVRLAAILLVLVAGTLIWLAVSLLPPLSDKLWSNVLLLSLLLTSSGLMLYLVADPRIRKRIWHHWVKLIDRLLRLLKVHHPLRMLQGHLEMLEKEIAEMETHLQRLRKQRAQLSHLIHLNKGKIQTHLDRAAQLQHVGRRQLELRKAARLRNSTDRYISLDRKLATLIRMIERLSMHSQIVLDDMREEITLATQKHRAWQAASEAVSAADTRARVEEALAAIEAEVAHKAGEVHQLMQQLRNWLSKMEVEAGVFAEEGLEMLEAWERRHLKYQQSRSNPMLPDRSSLHTPFDSLFDDMPE